ncbi:MAG TPA: PfkB family carbohydrate kinase [Streptosporangiaceae bacterium]|nr:PfkB family carbohydrate kinase [Streptosporangiaceae bacterium]
MRREAMLAIGVGEILWDRLPSGDEIGGAPFNVVSHLARFGYRAAYLTAVGQDPPGDAAIAEMAGRGIDTSLVSRADGVPTGLAQVTVGPGGSPAFEIRRPAAFERWASGDAVQARVTEMQPDVLVYGTLAQLRPGARDGLRRITAGCPDALALYDVNLRDGWWSKDVVAELLQLASVVKLSESEAHELAPVLGVSWASGASAAAFSEALATRLGLRGVAVTAGPDAASLWLDGAFAHAAPPDADVMDAVGAGDAFAAGLLDAIGRRLGAAAALRRANALGTLVASRRGAQPAWTEAELAELEAQPPPA